MSTSPDVVRDLDVVEVLTRLTELGPPSELRAHAAREAAAAVELDRALLTSIVEGALSVDALHAAGSPARAATTAEALGACHVAIEYPLVENEILRRRRARLVRLDSTRSAAHYAFSDVLDWTVYVVAPVVVDGKVVGFLHGDRLPSAPALDDGDAARLGAFAMCFALAFERAVLRQRLRVQHQQLRQVASWAETRSSELGDLPVTLSDADEGESDPAQAGPERLRDLLTRREIEVLELMVHGETNAAIARELVLSAGTVKFHVQNILRKLHCTNRAEATSRYLRLTLTRTSNANRG